MRYYWLASPAVSASGVVDAVAVVTVAVDGVAIG